MYLSGFSTMLKATMGMPMAMAMPWPGAVRSHERKI